MVQKGAAAAVEALCLLQDREEGTAGCKALAFPEHLQAHRTVIPENRGRDESAVTANEKTFDQHRHGAMKWHRCGECALSVRRS